MVNRPVDGKYPALKFTSFTNCKYPMPNEYSVEIHAYLTNKIAEHEQVLKEHSGNSSRSSGQLEELYWIREYLAEHIDLKDFTYY